MITNVETIYEFCNDGRTYGLYKIKLNRSTYYLIRNDQSLGAITHSVGHPAWECIGQVRDDVSAEFFEKLDATRVKANSNKQTMTLENWKLELIKIIINDKDFGKGKDDAIVAMEIERVIAGIYDFKFDDGYTPEEAWEGEKDAIKEDGD